MPAQVLRRAFVGVEFIASVVTSAMESQQVELIPMENGDHQSLSLEDREDFARIRYWGESTCDSGVDYMGQRNDAV